MHNTSIIQYMITYERSRKSLKTVENSREAVCSPEDAEITYILKVKDAHTKVEPQCLLPEALKEDSIVPSHSSAA